MSQYQLERYFKESIELIVNNSDAYFKEDEMTEEEYRHCLVDILKTFVNKFHTYHSQLLFSSLGNVKIDSGKPKLSHRDFDTSTILSNAYLNEVEMNCVNLNDNGSSMIEETDSPNFNVEDNIKQHHSELNLESKPEPEPEFDTDSYSSESEFETQCCARVGNKWFKIDDYSSEFLDKYPAGVFITSDGYVVGESCHNMIPDEEFDEGNIFCEHHVMLVDCEDIREPHDSLNNES